MSEALKKLLWIKFYLVLFIFVLNLIFDFFIYFAKPENVFYMLFYWKPVLILIYLFIQNFIFKFPKKIIVPPIIPSVFLILSGLLLLDIVYLWFSYEEILSKHKIFFFIYGILLLSAIINLKKFIKAFTTGIPD